MHKGTIHKRTSHNGTKHKGTKHKGTEGLSMDRNQEQVPVEICLFFGTGTVGINFSFTGTETEIPKSQINFVHERFFTVNRAVFK